jgi:hypothetical protein
MNARLASVVKKSEKSRKLKKMLSPRPSGYR